MRSTLSQTVRFIQLLNVVVDVYKFRQNDNDCLSQVERLYIHNIHNKLNPIVEAIKKRMVFSKIYTFSHISMKLVQSNR